MAEVKSSLRSFDSKAFSFLHLKIRAVELFVFTKHGCESQEQSQSSNYILSGHIHFYQYRQYRAGGSVCLFGRKSFCCKTRQDLSKNFDAIKSLYLEITN